jgi:alkylation response protein AidB-like acyl-CoA dehydrogenase
MTTLTQTPYLEALEEIIREIVAPQAVEIDRSGMFPREAMSALGRKGLLGLISAREVGGLGEGYRAATDVVGRLAQHCGSTAMVVCMHYAATAVIEQYGTRVMRETIAAGSALATLAFSETGSRSHFWTPVSTATRTADDVRLDGRKSWVTSAGQADVYVWSSRPLQAEGASSLWLVPATSPGLQNPVPFDGLGLRGNYSTPVLADGVQVPADALLGADGGGFDIMLGVVLPYFHLMSAGISVGMMEAVVAKVIEHVTRTSYEYSGQSLVDLPTIRSYVAQMKIKADVARVLLADTVSALNDGREDAMLRVLEVKAAAAEASLEVTEVAMRVCGGAAFRKETGIERNFRDARAATVMAPTTDVLYDFIGKAICGQPLFSSDRP